MSVRVRFAPSPTGLLHVGALRDALFKHLFAKHHGGVNILRIEDTDRSRYNAESEQEFIDTLKWVGIEFDEGPHIGGPNGPYRQSERKEAGIYQPHIDKLLESGHGYKAFETPDELNEMREFQTINKKPTGYFGGSWRDAPESEVEKAVASGKPYVIRQRIPRNKTIQIEDGIRGRIEWDSNLVDDPVLIKADGMPTYHFASMVDDHLMGITHIMRGEEWISSAPKHASLFDGFGWERPQFIHMPVIVGNDGKKLSKRHGATRVLDYAGQGFLPEALKNFIALIGWSPGDEREVMTEAELIEAFSISGLQPSPGRFDFDKLKWLNGHAIRALVPAELAERTMTYIEAPYTRSFWYEFEDEPMPNKLPIDGKEILHRLGALAMASQRDPDYVVAAMKEEQPRVQTLAEFGEACEFFVVDLPPMQPKAVEKWLTQPHAQELFDWIAERIDSEVPTEPADYERILKAFQEHKEFDKLGPVVHPTRVALTGKTTGPGLFELMAVLGRDRVKTRLTAASQWITA